MSCCGPRKGNVNRDEYPCREDVAMLDRDTAPCGHCGEAVYDDSAWCPKCGKSRGGADEVEKGLPPWAAVTAVVLVAVMVVVATVGGRFV